MPVADLPSVGQAAGDIPEPDSAWIQVASTDQVEMMRSSTAIAWARFVPNSALPEVRWAENRGELGTGTLWIMFVKGTKQYAYPNVPRAVWDAFLKAPSRGRFLHDVIRQYAVRW